jgi:4'-phosphopantetheinyl transferase EntD
LANRLGGLFALAGADQEDLLRDAPAGLAWLGLAEQRRYGELSPRRRAEFVAGRWLLRRLLQAQGVIAPGCAVALGAQGRPVLEGEPGVHLSLSHRAGRVVAGLADHGIGVDVERIKPRDVVALSERVCAPDERQSLQVLNESQALRWFHQLWAIKEAAYKAGLTDCPPLDFARVQAVPAQPPAAVRCWHWLDGWVVACAVDHPEGCNASAPWACADEPSHWAIHRVTL